MKHLRQQKEYQSQCYQLEQYQNQFVRQCMIQLGIRQSKKVSLDQNLLGLLYKINKCRKQLNLNPISVNEVDAFLPNRPAPQSVLDAIQDDDVPEVIVRQLTHSPLHRSLEHGFWNREKRILHNWRQSTHQHVPERIET